MNQRERILSILVGGLLIAVVFSWAFGKYRSAIKSRNNQITNLMQEQQRLTEQTLQGEYANRQMGEYLVRSLPGQPERAQSDYQDWLLEMVHAQQLRQASVNPNSSRSIGGLYQQIDFRVQGNTDFPDFLNLLHAFYAKDYLHRIRDLSIRPTREGDFRIEMSIDVIALLSAPVEMLERKERSWRVDGDETAYRDPIMNRNFFEPPNAAPRYSGRPEIEVVVGRESPAPLTFQDPEGHQLRFELAAPAPIEGVRLDERSGTLRIRSEEKQQFELLVRAVDDGYPRRSTEQKLIIKVVDPPPAPPPPPPKLAFDDATQTVLTALVQGRDEWTAWMHVRTRDTTLRLKVGDGFEIGSLKGTVVEVTPRHVMLEIEGKRFTLKPAGNLSEAAKTAVEPPSQ